MDYITKPTSRATLRKMAPIFRKVFNVKNKGAFPVLKVLEELPDVFPGCNYEVVPDNKLPANTMAQCYHNENPTGYTIEIKESVYRRAYNMVGADLGFICHELCHIFLFKLGFTPIHERSFEDSKLPAYCSVEWQAKALCGEVMIPREESKEMCASEIVEYYHVSWAFAKHRLGIR
ncbi:MAG: ImmA/IrrE family metallo-endopeptidase [Anaerovibrio sp.]|uniref:ImmA/IrrE family metallo-endopeptidase n=1 Tax=Anaerovibrio sp. TaxID=1872532 RepID=UPI0025BE25C3|nr:ImmA/IrrE family metallo-endopeptidase [Anaerovibrio sp.]MBE6099925.1 ImmA/IrrE family metallo-endopeptidase [Anaerovibrio sp.]